MPGPDKRRSRNMPSNRNSIPFEKLLFEKIARTHEFAEAAGQTKLSSQSLATCS
jgi:hypothetical protein